MAIGAIVVLCVALYFVGMALYENEWKKTKTAQEFCESLIPALEVHRQENGSYPLTVEDLIPPNKPIPTLIQGMIGNSEPWYFPVIGGFEFTFNGDQFFTPGLFRYFSGRDEWVTSSG